MRSFGPSQALGKHKREKRDKLIQDVLDAIYEHLILRETTLLRSVTIGDNSQIGYYGVFNLGQDGKFIMKTAVADIEYNILGLR